MRSLPSPMKAVAGPLPDDEEGWAYEVKWDGMRVVAEIDAGEVHAFSTNGIDVTERFGELDGLPAHLAGHSAVLDGEVVAFDGVRSDFARLQQRMHVKGRAEADRRAAVVPVCFVIFDLLRLDGIDTVDLPYVDRRRLLEGLVETGPFWQVPPYKLGDGHALLDAARANGLEGLVAKRLAAPYQPGKRSPMWRKVKVRREQELVVGGWTPGAGSRSSSIGALLLGYHPEPGDPLLVFAGAVGTGFDQAEAHRLRRLLDEATAADPPFAEKLGPLVKDAEWVSPTIVVQVEFAEWTPDGRLRHPAYLGQRIDTDPATVVREPTA